MRDPGVEKRLALGDVAAGDVEGDGVLLRREDDVFVSSRSRQRFERVQEGTTHSAPPPGRVYGHPLDLRVPVDVAEARGAHDPTVAERDELGALAIEPVDVEVERHPLLLDEHASADVEECREFVIFGHADGDHGGSSGYAATEGLRMWGRMREKLAALKVRFERLIEQYGTIALGTYFTLFAIVLVGFWVAIDNGMNFDGAAAGAGTFVAAYAATRLTQPIRIAVTLVLTPLIARKLGRAPVVPAADAATPPG